MIGKWNDSSSNRIDKISKLQFHKLCEKDSRRNETRPIKQDIRILQPKTAKSDMHFHDLKTSSLRHKNPVAANAYASYCEYLSCEFIQLSLVTVHIKQLHQRHIATSADAVPKRQNISSYNLRE